MRARMLRAGIAATLGVAFLAGSTPGYAAWQQAHAIRETPSATTGLGLVAGQRRVLLQRSWSDSPVDITGNPDAYRVVVGDTLTVELPVTLRAGSDVPRAVLHVEVPAATGDARLAAELAQATPALVVRATDGGPDLPAVEGRPGAWLVTPSADGYSYAVSWSTGTRPTRDGQAPRTGATANLWGAGAPALQGVTAGARPLTVTLEPEPAS